MFYLEKKIIVHIPMLWVGARLSASQSECIDNHFELTVAGPLEFIIEHLQNQLCYQRIIIIRKVIRINRKNLL